ncbi:MAG: lysylphosphatidylglycerol synthase transmembrane domain-containing protein [Acidobacteriota bacterium]
MKRRELILGLVALLALAGLFAYEQHLHPFNWRVFAGEFEKANWTKIALGASCIYIAFVFRGVRWAWLLRPNKRVALFSLIGTQVIGFTAVALIGRIADLVRPYLVSKRTSLPLGSQLAVYVVERLFDAGSMALLFCTAILLSPSGSLPHQELFNEIGKGGLALTAAGVLFLFAVRLWGEQMALLLGGMVRPFSPRFSQAVVQKIRAFHGGLDTLRTPLDFVITLSISLAMWCLITTAYWEGTGAFTGSSPALSRCLALMAGGGVASIIQLPVIGWFTQIAALQEMLKPLFGMSPETAMACATTLLLITFLGIAPVGLIWAHFEHLSLRKVTLESEQAGGKFAATEAAGEGSAS